MSSGSIDKGVAGNPLLLSSRNSIRYGQPSTQRGKNVTLDLFCNFGDLFKKHL